jgi:hypothetical protein
MKRDFMIKKFYGGSSSGPAPTAPYNPATDPGYQASAAQIAALLPKIQAAGQRMSPEQIIASLPKNVQDILLAQTQTQAIPDMSAWCKLGTGTPKPGAAPVNPVYAPQATGSQYNGPSSIDPSSLSTPMQNYVYLASLLGSSSSGKGK